MNDESLTREEMEKYEQIGEYVHGSNNRPFKILSTDEISKNYGSMDMYAHFHEDKERSYYKSRLKKCSEICVKENYN